MSKFKQLTLNNKVLIYLIFFSVTILFLVWAIQIFFFKIFYERYQIAYMNKISKEVVSFNPKNIFNELENFNLDNNICLEYIDLRGNKYYFNNKMSTCLLGKNDNLDKKILDIKLSKVEKKSLKLVNPVNNTTSLLYGIKIESGYIFLFSALEDIGTTTYLLKSQMIYITLIAILFAIVISYYLSKKISQPIIDITNKTKIIAKGNYDVSFELNGIKEIDELSTTLDYLEKEVAKTDEYRRDLMANVSHDLKTPLTMIKAYAEMVRDISYNNEEKRNNHLNIIIDETNRLNNLVNDILELSKIQANISNLEIEEFNLIDLLKDILKRYEIIKETENYNLTLNAPKEVVICADKKRFSQAIYNLINNAINYTGEDLKVLINVKDNVKEVTVEIVDTGKGINKKDIKNIWNKYYKKEKNHKRNIVGTGLGLSIVKGILEEHDFKYGVNSVLNKGTTFYIKIPKKNHFTK